MEGTEGLPMIFALFAETIAGLCGAEERQGENSDPE